MSEAHAGAGRWLSGPFTGTQFPGTLGGRGPRQTRLCSAVSKGVFLSLFLVQALSVPACVCVCACVRVCECARVHVCVCARVRARQAG